MRRCSHCVKLEAVVLEKDEQIGRLEGKAALLEYDLKQMREKWFRRKKKKKEEALGTPPRKRGAPVGHKGWFRRKPVRIDVTEEVRLSRCPGCGSADIRECAGVEDHIQEDIVVPQVKVTRYRHRRYWCGRCKGVVMGRGKEEIPNSDIGPNAKGLAALLKYKVKVSQRGIQELLQKFFGLRFVPSSVPGFHNQIRRKGVGLYVPLKEAIQKEPVVHADETGSPVDGKNRRDWVFASSRICLHAIEPGRGQKEVAVI